MDKKELDRYEYRLRDRQLDRQIHLQIDRLTDRHIYRWAER